MRKMKRIVNIALIFMLGGVFLFQDLAYSLSFSEKTLRVPSYFQQDEDTREDVVHFVRPSLSRNPGLSSAWGLANITWP